MADTITLIQYAGFSRKTTLSPPCAKVHMALALKKLPYEVLNITPLDAKKHNPRGRVPALRIGAETIVDSTDILTALDRRYPEVPLEPSGARERAEVKLLEDWADEVLYFYLVYVRWVPKAAFARFEERVLRKLPIPIRWLAPMIAKREAFARLRGQGTGLKDEATVVRELEECLDALEARLGSDPYLVGGALTRADLAVVCELDELCVRELTPEVADLVEKRPGLMAYRARVHERAPSFAG